MHVRNPDKNFIPGPHLVEGIALSLSPREEHLPFSITPHVLRESWMPTQFSLPNFLPTIPQPTMIIVLQILRTNLYLDDTYILLSVYLLALVVYSLVPSRLKMPSGVYSSLYYSPIFQHYPKEPDT